MNKSDGSDLSADGRERKCTNIFRTGGHVFSQNIEGSSSSFSDSFVVYSCSCYTEFRISVSLTGFHVFTLSLHSICFKISFGGLLLNTCAALSCAFTLPINFTKYFRQS